MNPFARLAERAEVDLADFGRRAVESVTAPLKAKSQEVIDEITGTVTATVKRVAIKAALGVVAAVLALIALGYGLSALHAYLVRLTGPIEATLIMAAVFAVLAVIALLTMMFWPKPSVSNTATAVQRDAERVANQTRERVAAAAKRAATKAADEADSVAAPDPALDMKSGLGAIASALGAAGFKREQMGLRAGLALADQLRPMQLVSLALIGGFVAGVRLSRKR